VSFRNADALAGCPPAWQPPAVAVARPCPAGCWPLLHLPIAVWCVTCSPAPRGHRLRPQIPRTVLQVWCACSRTLPPMPRPGSQAPRIRGGRRRRLRGVHAAAASREQGAPAHAGWCAPRASFAPPDRSRRRRFIYNNANAVSVLSLPLTFSRAFRDNTRPRPFAILPTPPLCNHLSRPPRACRATTVHRGDTLMRPNAPLAAGVSCLLCSGRDEGEREIGKK
jgi:hypothetical protein